MIEILLDRLEKVRPSGRGQWIACCPAHSDKSPSLGIKQLQDGRILMNCLAGCDIHEVLSSVQLTMSDLFPEGSLGEYKSFETLKRQIANKPNSRLEHAETVLALAKDQRKQGKRLSQEDMEAEKKAFMEVRRANSHR